MCTETLHHQQYFQHFYLSTFSRDSLGKFSPLSIYMNSSQVQLERDVASPLLLFCRGARSSSYKTRFTTSTQCNRWDSLRFLPSLYHLGFWSTLPSLTGLSSLLRRARSETTLRGGGERNIRSSSSSSKRRAGLSEDSLTLTAC